MAKSNFPKKIVLSQIKAKLILAQSPKKVNSAMLNVDLY